MSPDLVARGARPADKRPGLLRRVLPVRARAGRRRAPLLRAARALRTRPRRGCESRNRGSPSSVALGGSSRLPSGEVAVFDACPARCATRSARLRTRSRAAERTSGEKPFQPFKSDLGRAEFGRPAERLDHRFLDPDRLASASRFIRRSRSDFDLTAEQPTKAIARRRGVVVLALDGRYFGRLGGLSSRPFAGVGFDRLGAASGGVEKSGKGREPPGGEDSAGSFGCGDGSDDGIEDRAIRHRAGRRDQRSDDFVRGWSLAVAQQVDEQRADVGRGRAEDRRA